MFRFQQSVLAVLIAVAFSQHVTIHCCAAKLPQQSAGIIKNGPTQQTTPLSLDLIDSSSSGKIEGESSLSLDNLTAPNLDPSDGLDLDLQAQQTQKWTDNLRFATDLSIRPVYQGVDGEIGSLAFFGFDLHKVFTDQQGDWGTLTLQPYFARGDNLSLTESTISGSNEFELEYRIFNFNYTRHGKGKTNFRIGHFEIPFGLEQIINTNGTLRDFTHFMNFGIKSDWGVTFNGQNRHVEYELGFSRGSGNEWRRRDDPWVLAGRIGTRQDDPIVLGLSAFHGDVLLFDSAGGTVQRSRLGADFSFADEKLIYMAEVSTGFEDDLRTYTALFEVDWTDPRETVLAYSQFVIRGFGDKNGWDNEVRNSLGCRWTPDSKWTYSGQLTHFFDTLDSTRRNSVVELQVRYRF